KDMRMAFAELAAVGLRPEARLWLKYRRMMKRGTLTSEHLFMLRAFGFSGAPFRTFVSRIWQERFKVHFESAQAMSGEGDFWSGLFPRDPESKDEALKEFNKFLT